MPPEPFPIALQRHLVGIGGHTPVQSPLVGLIHAHATSHNAPLLAEIFRREDWLLYGPEWLREHLDRVAAGSWENSTAAVVAKLLLRPKRFEPVAGSA